MVDIKISELVNVSSNELTDLFEISRRDGSGWESNSVTYHDLLHSVVGAQIVTVGNGGAMATTIKEGIEKALTTHVGPPSVTNPVVILVQPDIYVEDNPLAIPDYVSIIAVGDNNTTTVQASDATSPIFTMDSYSTLKGFYLQNASGAGGAGVKGTGVSCLVEDCASLNCETGFWASGASSSMRVINCAVINTPGKICIYGFRADGEAVLIMEQCISNGVTAFSLITNGIYAEDSGTTINAPTFFTYYCTNGLHVDNGGFIDCDSGYIQNCTNGMRISSTGSNSKIVTLASSITNSITYDVFIESTTGDVDFTGKMDYNKRSVISGAKFESFGIDEVNEILKLTGKVNIENSLDIGVPGANDLGLGVGLDVGGGGSYDADEQGNDIVEYWQYDDSAASGSKFTRYVNNAGTQLTDENDAIVVGSKFSWSAARLDINVAANVGSNSIVTEHWNGSTWVTDTVCAYRKSDLTHRSNVIFQNVETQYVEFGTDIKI